MVTECPCRGCEKRFVGCHSACDKYIDWKKELDKENEAIRKEKKEFYENVRRQW